MKYFSSDNNSGAHSEILEAIRLASENGGTANVASYGADPYTAEAEEVFRSIFGSDTRAYLVFNGTAANVLGLKSVLKPYEGIVCAESAHIFTDECGAMESAGYKMYLLPHEHGKVTPEACAGVLHFSHSVHNVCPRVLSITQSTEYGALYTPDEIRALSAFCREHGWYLHMDGSRITNAAAALGLDLRATTRDLGVDILSLGGTKNGLLFGEAVVFLNQALGADFGYYRKQGMQLGSKMRFIAAQFIAYLKDGLWRANAGQANAMTALLAGKIRDLPGLRITRPVCVNSIFVRLPRKALDKLQESYALSIWDEDADCGEPRVDGPEVRIMTSFNTSEDQVEELAAAIRKALE